MKARKTGREKGILILLLLCTTVLLAPSAKGEGLFDAFKGWGIFGGTTPAAEEGVEEIAPEAPKALSWRAFMAQVAEALAAGEEGQAYLALSENVAAPVGTMGLTADDLPPAIDTGTMTLTIDGGGVYSMATLLIDKGSLVLENLQVDGGIDYGIHARLSGDTTLTIGRDSVVSGASGIYAGSWGETPMRGSLYLVNFGAIRGTLGTAFMGLLFPEQEYDRLASLFVENHGCISGTYEALYIAGNTEGQRNVILAVHNERGGEITSEEGTSVVISAGSTGLGDAHAILVNKEGGLLRDAYGPSVTAYSTGMGGAFASVLNEEKAEIQGLDGGILVMAEGQDGQAEAYLENHGLIQGIYGVSLYMDISGKGTIAGQLVNGKAGVIEGVEDVGVEASLSADDYLPAKRSGRLYINNSGVIRGKSYSVGVSQETLEGIDYTAVIAGPGQYIGEEGPLRCRIDLGYGSMGFPPASDIQNLFGKMAQRVDARILRDRGDALFDIGYWRFAEDAYTFAQLGTKMIPLSTLLLDLEEDLNRGGEDDL